jgi:hypothetical protein
MYTVAPQKSSLCKSAVIAASQKFTLCTLMKRGDTIGFQIRIGRVELAAEMSWWQGVGLDGSKQIYRKELLCS